MLSENHMYDNDSLRTWLEETLARYERPLLAFAWNLCGDREEARDAVQDTFLKLVRAPDSVQHDKIAAWLFSVCRNRLLDNFRKQNRMKPLDESTMASQTSSETQPDEALEALETKARIASMMADLPEQQRELLRLKFQSGLTYREIASITRLTTGNIGYLIHCAVTSLRVRWKEESSH